MILLHTSPSIKNLNQLTEENLPLVICGVAGVPGYNAFYHFSRSYPNKVVGLRTTRNWPLQQPGIVACDVENTDQFRKLLENFEVKTILNCGGSCALKSCELDPAMAERVNVFTVKKILEAIKGMPIKLLQLSIDLVFSGNRDGNYVESDPVDPVTVYGKTMVTAERLVLENRPDACVLRISLPMGVSFNGHAGAIDWIQNRFAKNKPATLYFDEIRTPTYVQCMNETYDQVIAKNLTGLYHAGGPRRLSLYQIAQIVNRVGGYDPNLLKGCPRLLAGPIPPRAGNVTLNSEKLIRELGMQTFANWPLLDDHLPIDPKWHFDRCERTGEIEFLKNYLYLRPFP